MLAPLLQQNNTAVVAPIIVAQPQSANVTAGVFATFAVVATGSGLTFQWFQNAAPISGATSATLSYGPTVYPQDSGAQFFVSVSNSAGTVISTVAVLIVQLSVAFITPPTGTTALDIIKGALRRITSYMSGESIDAPDAQDVLETLNDLLESLSTDKATVYCSVENILTFVPDQYQYTIGNYIGGNTSGTLTQSSNVVNMIPPSNMVLRGTVTDSYNALPPGTTIQAIGSNSITLSNAPAFSVAMPSILTYTIPGDFAVARPLRITNGFTRQVSSAGGIDFPFETTMDQARYTSICMKQVPTPWPIAAWYNPTFPLGNIYFYPNVSSAAELHLFTDTILTSFQSLTQPVNLPQGYARMLKWMLAREICTEYGFPLIPAIDKLATESLLLVKSLNQVPLPVSTFDPALYSGGRRGRSQWIFTGGMDS
jgi:hypothetical protein